MPYHTSSMCLFYEMRQLTGRNVIRTSDIPDISYYLRLNVFAGLISVCAADPVRSFGQRKANKLPTNKTCRHSPPHPM